MPMVMQNTIRKMMMLILVQMLMPMSAVPAAVTAAIRSSKDGNDSDDHDEP